MSFGRGSSHLDPLEPGDPRWRPPLGLTPHDVVDRVQRGLAPLLIVGHRGVGKTSLLRAAHAALLADRFAVWFDFGGRGRVDRRRALYDVAVETVQAWIQGGPEQQPSPFLVQDLRASDPSFPQGQGRTLPPAEIALAAWDELTGAAGMVEKLPLFVDGLDRLDPELGREIAQQLLGLAPRADLVLVASPALAFGVDNTEILDGYRALALGPVDPHTDGATAWLSEVVAAHAGDPIAPVARELVGASGGVLADLVGLARDAIAYADGPVDAEAVARAAADRTDRLRRLLAAGDVAALRAADGTDGAEVPADRKVRLLLSGLLLEYGRGASVVVRPHPLAAPLLAPRPTRPASEVS
jgi:hypothetical protein